MSGAGAVGTNIAAVGLEDAVEELSVGADVIVEPFDVPRVRDRAHDMSGDLGRAMRRDFEIVRVCSCGELEEAGDAAAARDVELKAVDRAGLNEVEAVAEDE